MVASIVCILQSVKVEGVERAEKVVYTNSDLTVYVKDDDGSFEYTYTGVEFMVLEDYNEFNYKYEGKKKRKKKDYHDSSSGCF